MASGTCCSRRSWEASRAFWAGWPLDDHAWFHDGRFTLLTLLAAGASNPFIDGVLVCRHPRPDLGGGHGGVVVRVIVVLVQVWNGLFGEFPIWDLLPFSWSRVGGIGAGHRAGREPQVRGLVGVAATLAVAQVLVRGWRVVIVRGHIVIVANAEVLLLLAGTLTGVRCGRGGLRGGEGQVLSDLRGLSGNFHRLLGGGGLLADVVRIFIVGVLIVVGIPFTLSSFWVVFIRIGVLRLGGVGDRDVTVRAVVLAVIIRCPVVRDEEQLLDVTLKQLVIQDPSTKDNDAIEIDHGVVTAAEGLGDFLLAVQDQGDVLLVDTEGNPVPLAIGQVDAPEQRVVFWARLPRVVLVEENG